MYIKLLTTTPTPPPPMYSNKKIGMRGSGHPMDTLILFIERKLGRGEVVGKKREVFPNPSLINFFFPVYAPKTK